MTYFEVELEKLQNVLVKIGTLAVGQVSESIKALLFEQIEGKEVKKTEIKIDKLDVKIDEICLRVFALQQPVASDLRFIMASLQISNEIERIGDLAMSVIKRAKNVKEKYDLIAKFEVANFTKDIEMIVQKTNDCLVSRDEKVISDILFLNKSVKANGDAIIDSIIDEMKSNPKVVVSGTNLVIALKHLERIIDHCSNVAEYIYFVVNAKIIKHEKFEDLKIEKFE